jgi:hypothetical protein
MEATLRFISISRGSRPESCICVEPISQRPNALDAPARDQLAGARVPRPAELAVLVQRFDYLPPALIPVAYSISSMARIAIFIGFPKCLALVYLPISTVFSPIFQQLTSNCLKTIRIAR